MHLYEFINASPKDSTSTIQKNRTEEKESIF